eukprot:c5907_g1_i1.p1 GENE.c5907_g1_i1~~c5907_g1_i1.p1  ORF type:complete len:276 (-),score=59.98 c5907_g1_i1:140-967(-)
MLQQIPDLDSVSRLSRTIASVAHTIVTSGRQYAQSNNSPSPLNYSWHTKEYSGAAHGVMGILFGLLHVDEVLGHAETVQNIVDTLDVVAETQSPVTGNLSSRMPTSLHHAKSNPCELVHFCHGASGAVMVFGKAYSTLKDSHPEQSTKYLEVMQHAAKCVWQYGLLTKGPGICHGVSGSAYALLAAYHHTCDVQFLLQAVALALLQFDAAVVGASRTPDHPLSLFEGKAGTLCLLLDVEDVVSSLPFGHKAQDTTHTPYFPFFEIARTDFIPLGV